MGQVYAEFQGYVKSQKEIGVLLCVDSKNEKENAIAGLQHPDGTLRPEDFIVIEANWEPKSKNIVQIAKDLNILPDSLVFVDDNPAEREIVERQVPGVAAPQIGSPEQYIRVLDRSGFFEVTRLSEDDRNRNEMYKANIQRQRQAQDFGDYRAYLLSLQMQGTIKAFEPLYMARIAQLSNKSNQFNLTTRRYTQTDIETFAADDTYITRYGKLEDKFGDNGVVSVVIGRQGTMADIPAYQKRETVSGERGDVLHLELWLMSCRVLKRDMEYAMMDSVVWACQDRGIHTIIGYYYPTAKNGMVREFYGQMGFEKIAEDDTGVSTWRYSIPDEYQPKNTVIEVAK